MSEVKHALTPPEDINDVSFVNVYSDSASYTEDGFSALHTRPWWGRYDPIWESKYDDVVTRKWDFPALTERRVSNRGDGVLAVKDRRYFSPVDVGEKRLYSSMAIRVMAIIVEYGMATTDQILLLSGIKVSANRVVSVLQNLWDAGLLLRMQVPSPIGKVHVWMLSRKKGMSSLESWLERLEPWQYQLVAAGGDPLDYDGYSVPPSAIRHNICTTEMLLRAMEACPDVIGAWGERHCKAEQLSEQKLFPTEVSRANIGDGAIVTKGGRVIIFETTGSQSMPQKKLSEKAGAWVGVCGRSDVDLSVVFVDISYNPNPKKLFNAVSWGVDEKAGRYVARADIRQRGEQKIFVAHAKHWFPTARMVSDSFATLEVVRACDRERTHILSGEEEWDYGSPIVGATALSLHNPDWVLNKLM